MKTMFSISMDYHKAIAQALKVEQAADLLKRKKSALQERRGIISACWEGDDADAYISKMQILEEDFGKEIRNLTRAADAIRTIAQSTYDTEQRAIELARNREY